LIEFVGNFGLSHIQAAADLSALTTFVMYGLLWQLIGPAWTKKRLLALAMAAVFPGEVFYFSIFPISLFVVLTLACLTLLSRRRYTWSGVAGAAAVWTYSAGILLLPVVLLFTSLFDHARHFGEWLQRSLRSAGSMVVAATALLIAYQSWVGKWNALFLVGEKYNEGAPIHSPFTLLRESFFGGPVGRFAVSELNTSFSYVATKEQTGFVIALVLLLAAGVGLSWRGSLTRVEILVAIYTATFWILPLTQAGSTALYRAEGLLVPCVVLLKRLPVALLAALVVIAGFIAYQVAALSFQFDLG
jgi:hypothetical protein